MAYVDASEETDGAVLPGLTGRFTYEELRDLVGTDGSLLPPVDEPPKDVETVAFVEGLAEARFDPSVIVGVCLKEVGTDGTVRIWLTPPIRVDA